MADLNVLEKMAASKPVSAEAKKMFDEYASGEFWEHFTVYPDSEYYWYDDKGTRYSVIVKDSTEGLRTVESSEFHRGNIHIIDRYRGSELIETNDPRKKKLVKKDPGPVVWLVFPNGKNEYMKPADVLALLNSKKAKRRPLSVRHNPHPEKK